MKLRTRDFPHSFYNFCRIIFAEDINCTFYNNRRVLRIWGKETNDQTQIAVVWQIRCCFLKCGTAMLIAEKNRRWGERRKCSCRIPIWWWHSDDFFQVDCCCSLGTRLLRRVRRSWAQHGRILSGINFDVFAGVFVPRQSDPWDYAVDLLISLKPDLRSS